MPPLGPLAGYDYVAVGHVCIDKSAERPDRLGGTAAYSGVQAARLGLDTAIVTAGRRTEIERLLEPFESEVDLFVQDAAQTTTFSTNAAGLRRAQRLVAWAGTIEPVEIEDAGIIHVGPVARETGGWTAAGARFAGWTPQGALRRWDEGGAVTLADMRRGDVPEPLSAAVLSEAERGHSDVLLGREDVVLAITAGESPTEIGDHGEITTVGHRHARATDDTGAGDVFACAFFVALAQGSDARAAADFAHAAAAVRITGEGVAAVGTRAAIESAG